ncbi:hypothetical protein A5730_09505 [Mycobacterium sp. ACS4054]|nr:hypothetical protein [Mycobacterium sp. ACS4054]OBF08501.1 hypothetical protein A5730_09505 [Mycobacterium sp. ACS4054]
MTLLDISPSLDHPVRPVTARFPAREADEADFRDHARRWRKALRGARLVYFGRPPLTTGVARWACDEGLGIGVRSAGELVVALAAGTDPSRIVAGPGSPELLRDAVAAGVGRIVLDSPVEAPHVAGKARRGSARATFDLVGLHCRPDSSGTRAGYGEAIRRTVAAMADIRARHGLILTEVHLDPDGVGGPQLGAAELAAMVEDALDEACAAEHFPRPVVVVGVTLAG